MYVLTDRSIGAAIDTISGFLVAEAAWRLGRPVDNVARLFYSSQAYAQLADPETGRYWDSLPELLDIFLEEIATVEPGQALADGRSARLSA